MNQKNQESFSFTNYVTAKEFINMFLNSKILLISISLIVLVLGSIYSLMKESKYQSTALIEIGQKLHNSNLYDDYLLVEEPHKLIQRLKIQFLYKPNSFDISSEYNIEGDTTFTVPGKTTKPVYINTGNLFFSAIENSLVKVQFTSNSPKLNNSIISKISQYAIDEHSKIIKEDLTKKALEVKTKIKLLENQDYKYKNNLLNEKAILLSQINQINLELDSFDNNTSSIKSIFSGESHNDLKNNQGNIIALILQLNEARNEKNYLNSSKSMMEMNLVRLENEIIEFELNQPNLIKIELEKKLKLLTEKDLDKTKQIGNIETVNITPSFVRDIIISLILGIIISIFTILLINLSKQITRQ